jgi:hypothetical protein
MSDFVNHLAARLNAVEAQVGMLHTPPAEVSRADVKALRAEIDALKAALKATQDDVVSRTAGLVKAAAVSDRFERYTRDQLVPLLGDALLKEQATRKRHVSDTLGGISAEITATKTAASVQVNHSATYLKDRASAFARGA